MASSSVLSNTGSSIGDGVSNAGKGVGQGVTDIGRGAGDVASSASQGAGDAGKTVGKGAGDVGKGVTDAGGSVVQGGAGIVGTGFSNGFELAANMSKNAFDLQRSVAGGVGGIAGTAVDGVVTAASATTGAVFDPLANSLKAVEGLESLGEGLDAINGLSVQSLQQVANATKKAIALAGQPPTFFNPDADGVVNFADTQRGFVLLGLEERYAKIAAYALHSTFTYVFPASHCVSYLSIVSCRYSTADAWLTVPNVSTLPVKITNLPKTRWGKNWGNYERVDWVNDADVETFFGLRERTSWTEYWTDMCVSSLCLFPYIW
ncbi:hypothetical protein OF83DRAFT_1071600 [Amylostereum chailletii]|nr:hypothetical protein OF83DRAFT_1071600 [Amylostereum chailletii]